jgi:deazaflavin-dependent oxidoreductase (nitroreductase family)
MTDRIANGADTRVRPTRAPRHVLIFGAFLKLLLRAGIPLGYNRLVTIPGRTTGLPRVTALAVLEIEGRRWVWAPWGEVNWVRNLRASGRATIKTHGRMEDVRATELDAEQRLAFFRDVLRPFARSLPFGVAFIRLVDGVDLNRPVEAASGRRVFELQATS